jgi:hypothetical protein
MLIYFGCAAVLSTSTTGTEREARRWPNHRSFPAQNTQIIEGRAGRLVVAVILAQKVKRLIRRRKTSVSEGVHSLLPSRHLVSIIRVVMNCAVVRCEAIAGRLYNTDNCVINQRGRNGI